MVERDLAKVDVAGPTPVSRSGVACFPVGKMRLVGVVSQNVNEG